MEEQIKLLNGIIVSQQVHIDLLKAKLNELIEANKKQAEVINKQKEQEK